jgi:hypothetical protein
MEHNDRTVDTRLAELSRLLDPGEELQPDLVLEVVTLVGELARRREALRRARTDADTVFGQLVQLARQRVPAASAREAVEAVDLEPLEEQLQQILEVGPGMETIEGPPLAILQQRERFEALLWGARELWPGEDLHGPQLSPLELTLERVDRLGTLAVDSFIPCNEQRRAAAGELDQKARSAWWWSLRASCEPLRLASLVDGILEEPQRSDLLEHLRGCEPCQEDLRALGMVDGLLGPVVEGHPPSRDLAAFAAGELPAERRQTIAEHLVRCEECRHLKEGAAAGLAEVERVERSLDLLDEQARGPDLDDLTLAEEGVAVALHQPFIIAPAPQPRALAADAAAAAAPVPRDRRTIFALAAEDLRAVYYVVAGQGLFTLFSGRLAELDPTAALDGVPLSPVVSDPSEQEATCVTFDLGPAARLPGRTLSITFVGLGGEERTYTRTFVTEGGPPR